MDKIYVDVSMRHRKLFGKRYVHLGDLIREVKTFEKLQKDGYQVDFSDLRGFLERMSND